MCTTTQVLDGVDSLLYSDFYYIREKLSAKALVLPYGIHCSGLRMFWDDLLGIDNPVRVTSYHWETNALLVESGDVAGTHTNLSARLRSIVVIMRHMIEAKKAQNTNSRKLIVRGAGMNLVFVVAEVGPVDLMMCLVVFLLSWLYAVSDVKLKRVQTYLLSYLLNAAVEDGKVDIIKETLGNDKPEVGSDIVKRALSYPMKLIAKNADCKECWSDKS
ncbi:hypothetical protein Tco_0874540 [Tanacetum coccineum]|uniref:Uncharacterized protein n=1 Tax=Tanacetum coccineum TaxID=301880 RepID=A0ABQ5BSI9_9ASTR